MTKVTLWNDLPEIREKSAKKPEAGNSGIDEGIAAFWVLLHHGVQSATCFFGSLGQTTFLANGFLGVDFFFVLSGFIIAFSSQRLAVHGGRISDYSRARLIRIYVPYLPIGISIYFLYLILPGLSEGGRIVSALTSFTFLPDVNPPALSVAWTLVHETIFYLVFSFWFIAPRLSHLRLESGLRPFRSLIS